MSNTKKKPGSINDKSILLCCRNFFVFFEKIAIRLIFIIPITAHSKPVNLKKSS